MRRLTALAVLGLSLGLPGCLPGGDTGFVEIKTFPSSTGTTLYLDDSKVEPIKGSGTVLRQRVGTIKLQTDTGAGKFAVLCELVIKKDRITSVTVSVLERPPRCQCRATDASRSARTCVG